MAHKFQCISLKGTTDIEVSISTLVVAGWTGRPEALQKHIEEMIPLGIPAPVTTPLYFRISNHQILQTDQFEVVGEHTSGEAEPIIIVTEQGQWIGLGSDETDRKFEATDIALSKQLCPKIIASNLWPLSEVIDHWDELILTSTITENGKKVVYQHATLADMTPANELMAKAPAYINPLKPGSMMMCGTIPARGGVRPTDDFSMELIDPVLKRSIKHAYRVVRLPHVA